MVSITKSLASQAIMPFRDAKNHLYLILQIGYYKAIRGGKYE